MKAILCNAFGDPLNLKIGEVESPKVGDGQVKVRVHSVAVNFHDTLLVRGLYQIKPDFPFTPGSDASGEVLEIGAGVGRCKPGDRVSCGNPIGSYAEEMIAPEAWVFPLQEKVDHPWGAAYRGSHGTAYFSLVNRGRLKPNEWLVVHGAAGGVGLAAVEIGHLLGARVIGTVGSADKVDIVRQYGADHVIDYSKENIRERLKEITNNQGVDVVLDVVGGEAFDQSLRCLNWDGRLLVVGFASGVIPKAPANLPLLNNASIIGVLYGPWIDRFPAEALELNTKLMGWLSDRKIKPHIHKTYPLEQAGEAMMELINRKAIGKVMLKVR
ncbi:NADPH:quinone oxidoreductase family protein [Thermodesulfobacteriota bacterium]